MIRKQARTRRDYLYQKSLQEKQKGIQDRRQKIRSAIENNSSIHTNMRKETVNIIKELDWGSQIDSVDDEYRWAGCEDPSIVITTSRNPSSRLKIFSKEIKLLFPNTQRINRGSHDIKGIADACRGNGVTDIIFLNETRGTPDSMIVSHFPHGPTAYFSLSNIVMRHDIPNCKHMPEQYPHLIFHNINSKIGLRIKDIVKHLFPVPKKNSQRVVTFANTDDFISFRQHKYAKGKDKELDLEEIGPRFELRPYCILLGTIDQSDSAETEWVLRSYISKGKKILSDDKV